MEIIASLRESLDQLDEVLEMLEEAERQKTADEREIDALRQQLRRFHRPPEEIPRHRPSGPARGGQREPHRSPRDHRGSHESHKSHGTHRGHGSRASSEPTATRETGHAAEENPPTPHGSDIGGPS